MTSYLSPGYVPATFTGTDVGVRCLVGLSPDPVGPGLPRPGRLHVARRAITIARDLDQTFSLGACFERLRLMVRHYRGDRPAIRLGLQQLAAISSDADMGIFRLWAQVYRGMVGGRS